MTNDDPVLTILNPHADDFFKTPVSFWLVGRRSLMKYSYLFDEPMACGQHINVLIDGTLSSLIRQNIFAFLPKWLRHLFLLAELAIWKRINGLQDAITIHWSPETIPDRQFLYMMSYKNCIGHFQDRADFIEAFTHKIINLSHYFILTGEKARNISTLGGVLLHAEADLRDNPYFQRFFDKNTPFLVTPFAATARFRKLKPLSERAMTCAATGSFHDLYQEKPRVYYKDFLGFFHNSAYHPIRKTIYANREKLADKIVCQVVPYREGRASGNILGKALNWLGLDVRQKKYFSFDIVNFYNSHVFAVIGEELSGLPAIGFFEALACGCVVLGESRRFYEGLGLVPNEHYLLHEGTVDSILKVMDDHARAPALLEKISDAASRYVETHCRAPQVWANLCAQLRAIPTKTPDASPAIIREAEPDAPLVSVIITAFNRANTIVRAINGVMEQTVQDVEIIVVDDASTDNTADIVAAMPDPRIRLIRNVQNRGIGGAKNVGVQAARGRHIAFLDSDDAWIPEKLERQLAVLNASPDVPGLCFSAFWVHRLDSGKIVVRSPRKVGSWRTSILSGETFSLGSTLLARREVFADIGLFNENLARMQDRDWTLRYLDRFPEFAMIDTPLVRIYNSGWPSSDLVERSTRALLSAERSMLAGWGGHANRLFASSLLFEVAVAHYRAGKPVHGFRVMVRAGLQEPRLFPYFLKRIWRKIAERDFS